MHGAMRHKNFVTGADSRFSLIIKTGCIYPESAPLSLLYISVAFSYSILMRAGISFWLNNAAEQGCEPHPTKTDAYIGTKESGGCHAWFDRTGSDAGRIAPLI